ncbi:hypothetical protein C7212DRAFT_275344 [Tuber magnatum]|uniref:Rhodopsin domain-containing protein n=1 Tax=Tuber magnatum TaxID=42249 RepID=A0A317SX02_9PEZI|nr:hypothetical protein C7212DRAFT_275344 [Tuber magnatum]
MYTGLVVRNLFGENPTNDDDDDSRHLMGSAITLIVLMGLVIITRIYCRAYLLRSIGADDWTMIVAAVSMSGLDWVISGTTRYGTGKHQWTLPKEWAAHARETVYTAQIFYFTSLGFCKASLILFVIRVTSSATTLRVSWVLLVLCSCFSLAAVITSILWCVPPEYTWKMFTLEGKDMKGVCLDQHVLQYTLPAINIFTDFVVWLLPLKMIWGIQLPPRQKAGLVGIFALGGLGVLAGILRLFSIKEFLDTGDPSWDTLDISIWSIVEATVSIICGSVPAIKAFFSKFLPGLLGVSSCKSYTHPTFETYGRSGTSKPTKPRSHPIAYPLSSLNPVTHHEESSSTEELGFGNSTKIEGRIASASISGSEECLNGNGGTGGHGGIGEGVKVTTDVQVHVEERI